MACLPILLPNNQFVFHHACDVLYIAKCFLKLKVHIDLLLLH